MLEDYLHMRPCRPSNYPEGEEHRAGHPGARRAGDNDGLPGRPRDGGVGMSAVVAYVFSADPTESVGGGGPAYVRVHVRAAVRAGYEPHGFSAWGYTAHRA